MSKPTIEYDLDGEELRITVAISDVENCHPDDVPAELWETFLAAREKYREGQREAWAYEDTRAAADEARNGRLR